MKMTQAVAAATIFALSTPAWANDTMAQLGTGGLVFVTNDKIQMASEELSISAKQIKVVYQFNNISDTDQHIMVAFPMPDIEGSGDFMVSVPVDDGENPPGADQNNLFRFATTFNGEPVKAELHQYAFVNNIDYSQLLRDLGVPLSPFGDATATALGKLSPADGQKLVTLGLTYGQGPYDDVGGDPSLDLIPAWTLRSTYSWEATFKPGVSDVVHTYTPSVGGTVAPTFMPYAPGEVSDNLAEYKTRYCLDDEIVNAVERAAVTEDGYTTYPFTESWISYIWSTGANWNGAIGKFTLNVDKGAADNLVSFCGDNVKKTGPTTFQMTATDWYPPEHELEILIVDRNHFNE